MIKFWKEDFKYIERHFHVSDPLGFTSYYYVFTVCGESANYLMNKYNLNGHDMKIGFFEVNNHILVGSCNERWKDIDMDDIISSCCESFIKMIDLGKLLSVL